MDVIDNLVGMLEVVPRYGGQLVDRRITVGKLAELVATFLPKSDATGSGATRSMIAFGTTELGIYAEVEDGVCTSIGVQLMSGATPAQRTAGAAALHALGALGLVLAGDEGEIDLADAAAVRGVLKAP